MHGYPADMPPGGPDHMHQGPPGLPPPPPGEMSPYMGVNPGDMDYPPHSSSSHPSHPPSSGPDLGYLDGDHRDLTPPGLMPPPSEATTV